MTDDSTFLRDFHQALRARLASNQNQVATKHCYACAAVLDMRAELCPSCGVRQPVLQQHVRTQSSRLVQCPDCRNEVSRQASKCVRCGRVIRRAKRGPFGLLFKWTFIVWNVLMLIWIISGASSASNIEAHNHMEETGVAIGTAIGVGMIMGVWMVGSVILGILVLLTKPRD
ncbi:MAG: hypothetical protein QM831_12740 [Kofleriaceae bacterium]